MKSKRKLNYVERKQMEYLKREKDILCHRFIGACEEINREIADVRSGEWFKSVQEGGHNEEGKV